MEILLRAVSSIPTIHWETITIYANRCFSPSLVALLSLSSTLLTGTGNLGKLVLCSRVLCGTGRAGPTKNKEWVVILQMNEQLIRLNGEDLVYS